MILEKLFNKLVTKRLNRGLLDEYKPVAEKMINQGLSGHLKLTPKSLWLRISENCNLKCVGCYKEGKFKKIYSSIDDIRKSIQFDGAIEEISFTTNEAMLHPQFCEIIDLCRATHPNAKLWIITNGTIPIKGRYKAAISKLDKVGLSIDGATKQTYESIRIGARFEDFLENAQEIIKIKQETGSPREISFAFTATSSNLHELISVVRLAHKMGATDVWAQSMEAKDDAIHARISEILIDNLDPHHRTQLIDMARSEADKLGIGFYYSAGLYPVTKQVENKIQNQQEDKKTFVRLCQYPWEQPMQISRFGEKFVGRPCCYIRLESASVLADKYGLVFDDMPSAKEAYNSSAMWNFRRQLLEGNTTDVCGLCDAARGYQWKPVSSK